MSQLETLIRAVQFVERQEQQKQATLTSKPEPPVVTPALPVAPPISLLRAKQEPTIITAPKTIQQVQPIQTHRVINNSFDIINPLVIDEAGEPKRKQPPMVFRAGTREVHNKLEKHRRAHLKECFDILKKQLPVAPEEKKTSNLNILHSALKTIQALKRRDHEMEVEMETLAKDKLELKQKLKSLKKEVSLNYNIDISTLPGFEGGLNLGQEVHIKDDVMEMNGKQSDLPVSISNELRLTKSITRALPVVTASSLNGIKEGGVSQSGPMQTAAVSVLPIGYPMNQGLVLQKVIVPKGLTQLVSNPPVTFIATQPQLGAKVLPLMNTQYVMKPLVVVTTPSRPS